ncbi:concanavalin A-like lectin/glucanase domain-containing protein [Catenaria anguillulae PL171]|uniref:Concanavalin A-like lectin/glucanase domain-containing protein n=1 Tax=Catenaria anguillulae PL171 TaxID=765915 RepID=A0A1Y2HQ84_9FUNG|nr:concanavalin A-like lectin/glucanase domain-containing protein [Catenaria anguillulae PL171]
MHTPLLLATTAALLLAAATIPASAQDLPDAEIAKLFPRQTCANTCTEWTPCCSGTFCRRDPVAGCLLTEGCDPSKSFGGKCIPVPLCKSFREDFNDPKVLINKTNYTHPDAASFWKEYSGTDNAYIEGGNLVLELKWSDAAKEGKGGGQGATIPGLRYMQYGEITARIKTAPGRGVVSSFITKTSISDTIGDELDFEMLGANPSEIQTNFYVNGQLDWTKGGKWYFPSGSGQSHDSDYHTYTLDWKPDRTRFLIDGKEIRSFTPADVKNDYPRAIQRVFFSVWDAGCNTLKGTQDWAGGETDWCKDASKRGQVRKMFVDWVEIKCFQEDTRKADTFDIKFADPNAASGSNNGGGSTSGNAGQGVGGGSNGGVRSTTGNAGGANAGDAMGSASDLGAKAAAAMVAGLGLAGAVFALFA